MTMTNDELIAMVQAAGGEVLEYNGKIHIYGDQANYKALEMIYNRATDAGLKLVLSIAW